MAEIPDTGEKRFWIVKWLTRPGGPTRFRIFTKFGYLLASLQRSENVLNGHECWKGVYQILYVDTSGMKVRDVTSVCIQESERYTPSEEERNAEPNQIPQFSQ